MILGIPSKISLPSIHYLCYESCFACVYNYLKWPTRIPRETPVYAVTVVAVTAYLLQIVWPNLALLRLCGFMLAIALPLPRLIRDLKR